MSYTRFQLIKRHIRIFNPADFTTNTSSFDRYDEWSKHIQIVSITLYHPGLNVSIDECMIRYTGRSKETTVVKTKPIPRGFKMWVVAQGGYFLRWLPHKPGLEYGTAAIPVPK